MALPVYDAAATLAFYTEVLQLPLTDALAGDDWGGKEWLMMNFGLADGRQIALVAFAGLKPPKANGLPLDAPHYAFAVGTLADLDAWKARLKAAKVTFDTEDHGDQRSIYFSDPNGIRWEITAPPSKREPGDKSARSRAETWIAEHADKRARR